MTATTTDRDEFVHYLVHTGRYWLSLDGSNVGRETVAERLSGMTHSLLVALAGCSGGLEPYKLAPKDHPSVDVGGNHLNEVLYRPDRFGDLEDSERELLEWLRARWYAEPLDEPMAAMRAFLVDVCRLFEERYELRALDCDEDSGEVLGERDDIAPGLAEAFLAAWDRRAR